MMRKTLWTIPAVLLFAAIGAPNAHAQTYNAVYTCTNFECTFPLIPTNNPISFAPSTPFQGPLLDVTFGGIAMQIGLSLADLPGDTYEWGVAAGCNGSECASSFEILDTTDHQDNFRSFLFPDDRILGNSLAAGGLTFPASPPGTVTPEPGTASLMLIGSLVAMMVMRKRSARGLFQSS